MPPMSRGENTMNETPSRVSCDHDCQRQTQHITVEPRMTLLDALREELALTGTKKGCDRGECGACTVHVDGRRILSCMTLAAMQDGKRSPPSKDWSGTASSIRSRRPSSSTTASNAVSARPGQIMSGVADDRGGEGRLAERRDGGRAKPFTMADLSKHEIRERMSGNLCRCACYPNIVDASPMRGEDAEPCILSRYREPTIPRRRSRPMPAIRNSPSSRAAPT